MTPLPDSDEDGMPDSWEADYGTNPAVNDSTLDLDGDGYSNIENYINGLFDPPDADVVGPNASLTAPVDNGANDFDAAVGSVTINQPQPQFQVSLNDVSGTILDGSVTLGTVLLTHNGATLQEGTDYSFSYDADADVITLTSLASNFGNGQYVISLNTGVEQISDVIGNAMDARMLSVEIDTSI